MTASQLLGAADVSKVIRMQLARIRPGVHIKPHVDLGGWATHSHRIHVPIVTSTGVTFQVSSSDMYAALCEFMRSAFAHDTGFDSHTSPCLMELPKSSRCVRHKSRLPDSLGGVRTHW
jgi:hypothetical protein